MEQISVPEGTEISAEDLAKKFSESFLHRCSYILLSIFAQTQFTGQTNPPQKGIVDHLNNLNASGRAVTERCLEDLSASMKKLNIWVSQSDLQQLVILADPFETGTPKLEVFTQILDKQKLLQDALQQLQFTVGNFFLVILESLEHQLGITKKVVAEKLEGYALQNGYDPNESFLNFYVFEEGLKSSSHGLLTDDQIVHTYSTLLTKAHTSTVLRDIQSLPERIAECVFMVVENAQPWLFPKK